MNNRSGIFHTSDYHSFSSYIDNAKRWDAEFRKLDKGGFWGRISMLDIDKVQILHTQIKGTIDQIGQVQEGYRTFIIPTNNKHRLYWMDTKIEGNKLLMFPKDGCYSGVSYNNFDIFAISIKETHLAEIAKECNALNFCKNLTNKHAVFNMADNFSSQIQTMLHEIFNIIKKDSEKINSPEFIFKLKYEIPNFIICFLNQNEIKQIYPLNRKRDKALNICRKHILENINKNIVVGELTKLANTSERTIEYAFRDRYGISPKAYITYTKLNKIKNILNNPKNYELVSTIARQFGFTHMGQFSADYKKLFGELPSKTLSLK